MLSSKNDARLDERFTARLDVLMERVDTLAATVATTASAIAKKDGEIASLRRDLQTRDEALQALAAQSRNGAPIDARELHELRRTVEALANDRTDRGSSREVEELAAKLALLGQRLETLSTTVSATAAGLAGREGELATIRKRLESVPAATTPGPDADPALRQLLDDLTASAVAAREHLEAQALELAALKVQLERRETEPQHPFEELRGMLTTLRARVEALAELRAGVGEEELDQRLAETDGAVAHVSERVEALAGSVESAIAGVAEKEHELAALHRHFTESSSRIESVVDDIREALSAFPPEAPGAVEELTASVERLEVRLERVETTAREAAIAREQELAGLAAHIDLVDQRVVTVATDIDRAKTLWPIALRSLEARLDDAMHPARHPEPAPVDPPTAAEPPAEDADDLLAGLRDSLQAMETVAEEMARASEVWSVEQDPAPEPAAEQTPSESDAPGETASAEEVVRGGARIVPLHVNDP